MGEVALNLVYRRRHDYRHIDLQLGYCLLSPENQRAAWKNGPPGTNLA